MSHPYTPEQDLTAIINKMRAEGAFTSPTPQSNPYGFFKHGYEQPETVWSSHAVMIEILSPSGQRHVYNDIIHEQHQSRA